MRIFISATIIWTLIFYIKGKYFEVHALQNDVDYVADRVWVLFVPVAGLLLGGFTFLLIKFVKILRALWTRLSRH